MTIVPLNFTRHSTARAASWHWLGGTHCLSVTSDFSGLLGDIFCHLLTIDTERERCLHQQEWLTGAYGNIASIWFWNCTSKKHCHSLIKHQYNYHLKYSIITTKQTE